MASTSFFVMIKPDGVRRNLVGEIISRFERKGFTMRYMEYRMCSRRHFEEHYREHEGKNFYDALIDFSCSGPVVAIIFEGNIQVARKIVGETIPWQADVGTIRGDFACSLPDNLVHCSDSVESAKRELALWFEHEYAV